MARHNGHTNHGRPKPQANRSKGGSPASRQRNHFQHRVFGDVPKQEQEPESSFIPPRVQRAGGALTYLSIREIDNFGNGLFRRPPHINMLHTFSTISALSSRNGGITRLEKDIDRFCADRTPEIPYIAVKDGAQWYKDGNNGFRVYAFAAPITAEAINDEIAALYSALDLTNPKPHRKVPIAGFGSKTLAVEFADTFNEKVLPTDAQIFTLDAIHRIIK